MIDLINHKNSPVWSQRNGVINNYKNGARRYSEMITEYYFPVFEEFFKNDSKRTAVITVTTENKPIFFENYDRIFCFRHECRYKQQPTISRCLQFAKTNQHAEVIFVVWEESTAKQLRKVGLNAIFLPMAIDVEEVRKHLSPEIEKEDAIIWYGQLRRKKRPFFEYFASECRKYNIRLDYISNNKFNGVGEELSREEIMKILQRYKYGVGVGICAHEMSALGLKVFIYSYTYRSNCAYSDMQGKYYINRNLCSPEEANISIERALADRERMVVIKPVDIRKNTELLYKILSSRN